MTALVEIAKWVDESLAESVKATRAHKAARVVGVTAPGNGKFRTMTTLDSDPDPYDLLTRPPQKEGYEALVIIMTGTMRKINEDGEDADDESFTVRICATVNDEGVAVAVRREGGSELEVDMFPDGGEGAFPDALRTWWSMTTDIEDSLNSLVPND